MNLVISILLTSLEVIKRTINLWNLQEYLVKENNFLCMHVCVNNDIYRKVNTFISKYLIISLSHKTVLLANVYFYATAWK